MYVHFTLCTCVIIYLTNVTIKMAAQRYKTRLSLSPTVTQYVYACKYMYTYAKTYVCTHVYTNVYTQFTYM
jgi:hypothetical protein